ncbi:MAG: N-acetyltransferase family protein [Bacteroidota bacterium]
MIIQPLTAAHAEWVKKIHQEGIATGIATFETDSPSWEEWDRGHLPYARFVATEGEKVLGWAALTPISSRCVYAGVAEVSVYVSSDARAKGVGKALLLELVKDSEQHQLWTLQAGIISDNKASIALHEKVGFRIVGVREKLGQYKSIWHDVVLMERRSNKINYES